MGNLVQKTIDQYLAGKEFKDGQKDILLAAITPMVYDRNQNVIKAEAAVDEVKKKQYRRSVEEYDQLIEDKIQETLNGKVDLTYDF